MDLSNREIASLIWMAVLVIAALAWRPTRGGIATMLRAFFQRILLIVFGSGALYVLVCVMLLAALHVWTWDNLKTTIVWGLGFAFVSMFSLNRIDEDRTYFRRTIREALSFTGVMLFIVEFYAFSLVVELIMLPVVTFMTLMKVVAEGKAEHAQVHRLFDNLLAAIGLSFFAWSSYRTVLQWSEFATTQTLREFALPIVLTLLFLPYLYVMSVYFVYNQVFTGLFIAIKDDGLRRFAKRRALLSFGLNTTLLKRWRRMVMLERPESKEAIARSFQEVKTLHAREKNPPAVDPAEGWSPYAAKEFLAEAGVVSEDYHRSLDAWHASSKMFKLDSGFGNALMYHVDGTERAATRLSLELTVNKIEQRAEADGAFTAMARLLLRKAIGDEAESWLPESLDDLETAFAGTRVSLKTESWTINKFHAYERDLTIEHPSHRPNPYPEFTD